MSIISFSRNLFNCITEYVETIHPNGTRIWQKNGMLHRENGPAVIRTDLSQFWYLNGELHRTDGPAVICDEYQAWYLNGKRHREDGPALIWENGSKYWFLNDVEIEYNVYHKSKIHFEEIKFTIKDGL